tara:strand:- start:7360 stop:7923 length:564 start_codon:yes stop_codon:yes gene_type:complete
MQPLLLIQTLPETATWLELLLKTTIVIASAWLLYSIFVLWRRSATNLTPVTAPGVSGAALPDFLAVDKVARKEALERGDAYEAMLKKREREASQRAEQIATQTTKSSRFSGFASATSLIMSVFSLTTMITGAVWQVSWIGAVFDNYSTFERIAAVFKAHPFAFSMCAFVILYHIVQFFLGRQWRAEA